MTKTELIELFDLALQAMPTGLLINDSREPSEWSKGYYNGLEIGYRTALSLIEQLDDLG